MKKIPLEFEMETIIRLYNAYKKMTGIPPDETALDYFLNKILDHWEKWEKEKN